MGPVRERNAETVAECLAAVNGAELSTSFPDLSGLPVARRFHWGRWLAVVLILAAVALLVRAFAQGQIEWNYVGRFITVPVILTGIVNTMVMAVLAMALGIVLGVVVAIMRLSPNPCWPPSPSSTPGCFAARR